MVFSRKISDEEFKWHNKLIAEFCQLQYHVNPIDIKAIGSGNFKAVYKVELPTRVFVVAASSHDKKEKLVKEYGVLHTLYDACPDLYPEPIAHYKSNNLAGDIMITEYLRHKDLTETYDKILVSNFDRRMAFLLGYNSALVNLRTSLYSEDPHDGNIMIQIASNDQRVSTDSPNKGKIDMKFCDAGMYAEGGIEQMVYSILINPNDRQECTRFINQFRDGIATAIVEETGVDFLDAARQLNYMNNYTGTLKEF